METKEQEVAIGELEERVDRLRVLYEQYFLGFEKLEPMVPRKDVDRRFAVLRKEQIRNTALRFKLNVVTQKYNTYSMYWVRICRQIEEGTYKRDVRRAKQRFGDAPSADASVEIDISDFDLDGDDLDAVLAEADAAAAAYERAPVDTVPPAVTRSIQPAPVVIQNARGMVERAPAASAAPSANTRAARPYTPAAPLAGGQPARVASPAALPQGAKPKVVVRRAGEASPPSQSGQSAQATGRTPVAAPASPSAASTGRYPVAQQYANDPLIDATPMPPAAPPPRAPNPMPARQPAPVPSSGARAPVAPVARPLPISAPRQQAPAPVPGAPARGAPVPEGQRPQIRPRMPLPLPSQVERPKKDE